MKLITLVQVSDADDEDERNIAKLLTVSLSLPILCSLFHSYVFPRSESGPVVPSEAEPAGIREVIADLFLFMADLIPHLAYLESYRGRRPEGRSGGDSAVSGRVYPRRQWIMDRTDAGPDIYIYIYGARVYEARGTIRTS
jgi:hypothetical protein